MWRSQPSSPLGSFGPVVARMPLKVCARNPDHSDRRVAVAPRILMENIQMRLDQQKLGGLLERVVGDLSAGYGGVMVSLGSKLGLYKALAGAGPLSSQELASRANCAERYVREWLNSQV